MQVRNLIFAALMGWGAKGQPLQRVPTADAPMGSYLGVGVWDVSGDMAKVLKLPGAAGVEVTSLDPSYPKNPAALAGIKVGDVVLQFNGQRVEDREQFARMVRETPAGKEVKLQIYRNGVPQIIVAKLVPAALAIQGGIVGSAQRSQPSPNVLPDIKLSRMELESGVLGAELESLEGQLAIYFGVKDGVLVRSVMQGSAGERAGLKAGDVITRVSDAKVTTPDDVSGRLRATREQSAILTVRRERADVNLAIPLDGGRPGEQ